MKNFDIESVDTLLDLANTEYSQDQSGATSIDSKVNISLPIIAVLFLAIAGKCALYQISKLPSIDIG